MQKTEKQVYPFSQINLPLWANIISYNLGWLFCQVLSNMHFIHRNWDLTDSPLYWSPLISCVLYPAVTTLQECWYLPSFIKYQTLIMMIGQVLYNVHFSQLNWDLIQYPPLVKTFCHVRSRGFTSLQGCGYLPSRIMYHKFRYCI